MNTDYFKYLSTVAECHSIRQAAEKLHLKQQYLGTIVKNIETHYDITIFNRTHRGITLTKDGQFFLERAQQINQLLQELESPYLYPSKQEYSYIVKDITIYMLNLATPGQFINIIDAFHNHFPYININIFVKNHKELVELVEEDPNAIGLLYISEKNTPQHQLLPEILQVTPFGRCRLSAITSQYNKEAHHLTSISFYDFLQKQLVLYSAEEMDDNVVYEEPAVPEETSEDKNKDDDDDFEIFDL